MTRRIFDVNPIRSTLALPGDINLDDIGWVPGKAERAAFSRERNRLAQLEYHVGLKAKWDAEELAYYKRKCQALVAVVESDRAWIQRQKELEAELKRVQDYYAQEHAREEVAADKARREKCLRLGKEIYRDAARAERRLS